MITTDLKHCFGLKKSSYEATKTLIQDLSKLPIIKEVGFLAFLGIIDTLIKESLLDYSDIKQMTITHHE
ncbi:hypothetical protein IJU97_01085 [bacterium]|nr:hypothetical protein [bacterium]